MNLLELECKTHIKLYQEAETAALEIDAQIIQLKAQKVIQTAIMKTQKSEIDNLLKGKGHMHDNEDGSQLYIHYKKSTSVKVTDVNALPDELVEIVPETTKHIHRTKIGQYIKKNGIDGVISGAHFETTKQLTFELQTNDE